MKYSNELKVGATILVATVVFILGVRYFEDLPLLRGTYNLETELDNAAGLISGNVVRVSGVTIGSVNDVFINPETGRVRVRFHVDKELPVTEGSTTQVSGFDALGVVRMDLTLGPADAPRIVEGGFVPPAESDDLFADLTARAPELLDQFDGAISSLGVVLDESGALLSDPESDLRLTLLATRRSVETMDNLLRTQRERIASVLENVDGLAGELNGFMAENGDSLAAVVGNLSATMARLDGTLENLEQTTTSLNELLGKINSGEGSLGRLVNDDSMYLKVDSVLTSLQLLMTDFQENPGKYLKEMRLVDLF